MFRDSSTKLCVPAFTAWRISTISTKELYKGYKPQSSKQEEAQSHRENKGTTLDNHKDHKQHLSQYKILEDRFCNDSSNLWENKNFESETQKKYLEKLLEWYRNFNLKLKILKTYFLLFFNTFEAK